MKYVRTCALKEGVKRADYTVIRNWVCRAFRRRIRRDKYPKCELEDDFLAYLDQSRKRTAHM